MNFGHSSKKNKHCEDPGQEGIGDFWIYTAIKRVVADHSTENQNAEKYGKFILDPGKWVLYLAPVNQPQ
jgi:hypothetical protein